MEIISQGAEAILKLKNFGTDIIVEKKRIEKKYRIIQLDNKLRKSRTRRETKILEKLNELKIPCPKLITSCDKKMIIEMEYIKGVPLKNVMNKEFSGQVGTIIAQMHSNNIVHADLTTANFLVKNDKVYVIDFGLSFVSQRTEDKAVDIHLFERSLNAHHTLIKKECWKEFLNNYNKYSESSNVLKHLIKVEKRGRNK